MILKITESQVIIDTSKTKFLNFQLLNPKSLNFKSFKSQPLKPLILTI